MNGILLRWLQIQCGLCLLTCAALGILLFQYSQNVAIKSRSDRESETTIAIASKIDEMRKIVPTAGTQQSTHESVVSRVRSGLAESNINESHLGDIRSIGRTVIQKTTLAREDTAVVLKVVELIELFSFVQSQESQAGILVSGIELRTTAQDSDESDKDKWDAQLTLTQVIEQTEKLPKNKSKGEG